MKLRSFLIVLSLILVFVLSGCNKEQPKPIENESEVEKEVEKDDVEIKEIDDKVDEERDIEDNAVVGNVTLEINKYIQRENPETFNEAAFLRENDGVVAAQVDKDGVLTVRIKESRKKEIAESLKGGLDAVIDGLTVNPETNFIKNVDVSDDYTTITLTVNKEGFEQDNSNIVYFLATAIGSYQTYADIGHNVQIDVKDEITNEIILSEKYPDKIEAEIKARELEMKEYQEKLDSMTDEEKAEHEKQKLEKEASTTSSNGG